MDHRQGHCGPRVDEVKDIRDKALAIETLRTSSEER
jgi:hypothetical protein